MMELVLLTVFAFMLGDFDGDGEVMYVLQDGNANVVALLDVVGEVLVQYTYAPYGELLVAESR